MSEVIQDLTARLVSEIRGLNLAEQVAALNEIRTALHGVSPFKEEPVDLVVWVPNETVEANDYNPNRVAKPEMELLATSIRADGYTQPIVSFPEEGKRTVVDGFHRNRVGKEVKDIRERVKGYLPVVTIRPQQEGKPERMASCVRHNRARGSHEVVKMVDLIAYVRKKGWDSPKIMEEFGMDADEVMRLSQISGIAELFKDQGFSKAWSED